MDVLDTLKEIGVDIARHEGRGLEPRSPIDGQPTVGLRVTTLEEGAASLGAVLPNLAIGARVVVIGVGSGAALQGVNLTLPSADHRTTS